MSDPSDRTPPRQPPPPPPPGPPPALPVAADDAESAIGVYRGVQSIGIGLLGIALPVVTGLFFSGKVYFFVLLPIFGLIRAFNAITRGSLIAGWIGVALNLI